jgi:TonB family protein
LFAVLRQEWFSDMCAASYSAQPPDGAGSTSIDRRAQLRVRLLNEGLGELIVADLGFSGGLIHDLSEGGLSLQLAGPMPPVPEFNVHFKLGYGASSIEAKARPVWRGAEGNIGVCFEELSEEARDQLTHWLNGRRDIVQRETMTGEESAVAAPTAALDDPSDRTEEKDSLVSKLARAYSALSSQQHAAALFPVGDGPIPNPRVGSALETAPETESPERNKASFEVLRNAIEREVRREKALDVVTGKRGGDESTVICSDCGEANPRGHHFCGTCGAQLEYGRLPQIGSSDKPTGTPARENNRPLPVIPPVASATETEAAREQLIETGTVGAIVAEANKLTRADGVALVLAEGKKMLCKASIGKAPRVGEQMDVNAGLSGQCMRTGQVVTCDDAGNDLRVPLSVSRDLGLQSIIIVPIRSQEQVVGLLEVTSGRKAAFSSVDVARLQALAEEALSIAAPSLLQTAAPPLGAARQSGPMSIDRARNVEVTAASKESIGPAASKNEDNVTGHYGDAAITTESEHQESVEHLISKFRAANSRAVPDEPQPELLNIKDLRQSSGSSLRPIPVFQSHSPKTRRLAAAFRQVPPGWSVLLLAGMVLVGAIAGWSLSVMKTPIDLALTITSPPVADTMVLPIAAADTSSSGIRRSDGRVELPRDVAAGQVISSPTPKYPEEARKENISGTVSLMVSVDNAGFVDRVEVVSGNPILADAAVKAVKQWRYRHYLFGGQAVGTLARVSFLFTLPGR